MNAITLLSRFLQKKYYSLILMIGILFLLLYFEDDKSIFLIQKTVYCYFNIKRCLL